MGLHSWERSFAKYGSVYAAELAALREGRRGTASEAARRQCALLSDFLCAVLKANEYYGARMRERGLSEAAIREAPERSLLSMELLTKSFLRANAERLASGSIPSHGVAHTSGTTGSPMAIPYDSAGYQKGFAYWRRFYDEMGLPDVFQNARFSGRILLGAARAPTRFWVYDWYERRLFMSTYHLTSGNLPAYVQKLNELEPALIDGYPSAIAIVARFVQESGKALTFSPVAVATTAETLREDDRALIEEVFECPVFNQYASSEGAPFITECRQRGLHLNTDTGYFEFHDLPGDDGLKELVVTSFRNLKLPLIRYRIGDTVRLLPGEGGCACGSPFPEIGSIEGRVDDILYSRERGAIGRLDPVYKGVQGIESSQIRQEGVDNFRILVVAGPQYTGGSAALLEENFRSRVGRSVALSIERVDSIPLSRNGKFRAVVNCVPRGQLSP